MTFKANWEKTTTRVNLSEELILKMLGTYTTCDNDIKSVSIIPGGCANINVLVQLNVSDTPVILRVYLRDKESVYREQKISSLLHKKLPVPEFYHVGEYDDYTFAIIEYLPGQTLRDLLLKGKALDINDIMFKVGRILGEIANIKFPSSGFFNKNLEVEKSITPEGFVGFCFECLENNKVKATLPQQQREQIKNIFRVYKNLLPERCESNLVHADFDPANILITEVNGQIEVSGILDWEFSFAGSTLCDVANMLRYAHQMPNEYQDSFLKGLRGSGYELPSSWQITVNLLNIVSLLDCLVRSDSENRPNQIKDIQELINNILEAKCWRKVLKSKQEWSEQLHDFLRFIRKKGASFVPMPLGFENNTYEILNYVDGDTCDYPLSVDIKSKEALISSAKILRKYHDVSEKYIFDVKPSIDSWMFPAIKPIEVICHNDFAPYNICFKNKQAIGIIDFEAAIPGPRIWDIAYALYRFAPFTSPNNSDGFGTLPEQIERATLFCDTYELHHTERLNLTDTIIARLEDLISFLQSAADNGDKKYQCNIKDGHLQLYSQDLEYIRENKEIIDTGLITHTKEVDAFGYCINSTSLSMRKATASDAKEISNLIISCLRETNAKDYSPDIIDRVVTNFTPEKVSALIESRDVFIATQNNLIIGTVSLDQNNIRSLFILPEKQNCGVGAHLMQHVENIAKEQGCNLLSVPSSVTAEGFYKKLGYKVLRDEYYDQERTIIMEKMIGGLPDNSTIRLLKSKDNKLLEEYLEPHKSETMFICSNLQSAGIEYKGEYFEGEYFGYFNEKHDNRENLLGIIVHYWNGNIMMHASNNLVLERLTTQFKKHLNRDIAGVLGISDQASYVINELGLSDSVFSINREEGLYDLCLSSLNTVDLPIDCNIIPAKEVPIDTIIQWMTDYEIEALGAIKNDALSERVNNKVERIRGGNCFALLQDNVPVSLVGFNSKLKDMLQIGPVWTPTEYRNKGFARRLLACALLKEKSHGIKKAILFTDNSAAIKAYEAIGFKEIGTYRLALLKDPIALPAQKSNVEAVTAIETDRLVLSRPEIKYNECLANLWRDKEVREYLGGVLSEKEIENKITLLHKHWKTHNFGFWVVLDKKSEQVFGLCGLSREDSSLELSYMFFSQYWGQGIAQEAIKVALIHGFKKTGEKEIICITQKENARSCKLLKKLGMKHVKDFERFNSIQSLFSIKHHLEDTPMGKQL